MHEKESQIEAAARNLVRRFGEDAPHQAEIRIAELKQHGEAESLEFWLCVRDAVAGLLQAGGSTTH